MSLIGKSIIDFKVQSYVDGAFKEVTKKDVLGKWSVFFFYPADFTFVCPTELEDLANKYEDFKKIGCDYKMRFDFMRLFMGSRYAAFYYSTAQTGGYVNVTL